MILNGSRSHRWTDELAVPFSNRYGTAGDDYLTGGRYGDNFYVDQGGEDTVKGRGGDDAIFIGSALSKGDRFDGGPADDSVYFQGQYSGDLLISHSNFTDIEHFNFEGEYDYHAGFKQNVVGESGQLYVVADDLDSSHFIYADATAIKHGSIELIGGHGGDGLYAGGDDALLIGHGGADYLVGNAGATLFSYTAVSDSTADDFDLIANFTVGDKIDLRPIDADPNKPGGQAFHFGATANHAGDVTVTDDGHGETIVRAFVGTDASPDLVIYLVGNHADLTAMDFLL